MGRRPPSRLRPPGARWWEPTDRIVEPYAGAEYVVRQVPGARASKAYRCPGCNQEVRAGVAHLVAWPADGVDPEEDRRHWHSACWARRDRLR